MAIIKCSECGGQVSNSAKQCPHCGALPKKFSKSSSSLGKVLLWIVAIGVVASIFSPKRDKNIEPVAVPPVVESHVVAATSPSPASTLPATSICKAAIAVVMGRPTSSINTSGNKNPVELSYIREADGSKWEYQCRIDGDKIIWRGKFDGAWGRWREHPDDSVITFKVAGDSLSVTETYTDGSATVKSYPLSVL